APAPRRRRRGALEHGRHEMPAPDIAEELLERGGQGFDPAHELGRRRLARGPVSATPMQTLGDGRDLRVADPGHRMADHACQLQHLPTIRLLALAEETHRAPPPAVPP